MCSRDPRPHMVAFLLWLAVVADATVQHNAELGGHRPRRSQAAIQGSRDLSDGRIARRRAVAGESSLQSWAGSTARLPRSVGQPLARMRSFSATGTPSTGPSRSPRCQRTSDSRADASADSASSNANALTCRSRRSIRASTACVASTDESDFVRYRSIRSKAERSAMSSGRPGCDAEFRWSAV
ncbi:hypothetical protein V1293_002849 [Bradyrhizobium sp. AZCC 1693]